MSNLIAKPENTPWLSPYFMVKNVDQALKFYQAAFGFKIRDQVPGEDGCTWHAEMTYYDQLLMLGKEGAWGSTAQSPASSGVEAPISLYMYTENVDEFYQHAKAQQAQCLEPPTDMFWGDRMCKIKDQDGYIWCFATSLNSEKA
jgi:uncharacterized glyoxalase superfamily protein PhnB